MRAPVFVLLCRWTSLYASLHEMNVPTPHFPKADIHVAASVTKIGQRHRRPWRFLAGSALDIPDLTRMSFLKCYFNF